MTQTAASDFSLPSTGGGLFELAKAKAAKLVIYFYPKDNTPGCTTESAEFRDAYPEFKSLDCEVIGISRDSLTSHESFKTSMGLPFELLSDADELVCNQFGVIKMKNLYGKQVRGVERSTFVLDRDRAIRREWRSVRVPGHVEEVLSFVKTL